jgi:pyridoxamine 5'-phosphate oxidase
MNVNPEAFRTAAMARGLGEDDLNADPILQFQHWYAEAIGQDLPEPNAMALATVDTEGQPYLRTVLLKLYDRQAQYARLLTL